MVSGQMLGGQERVPIGLQSRSINADQVAWMVDAIKRYLPAQSGHPRISRQQEVLVYGLLYEIMDAAHLTFADAAAQSNATPMDVRKRLA